MLNYQRAIDEILKLKVESMKENEVQIIHLSSNDILNSLKLDHKAICDSECENAAKSKTKELFDQILKSNHTDLMVLLKELLEILYLKDSPMMKIVYQTFPTILRKYIESQDSKSAGSSIAM
jgi:hypothetical protein